MKKILAFIVAAILCLTCFAACSKKPEAPVNNESTPAPVVYDVDDAAAYRCKTIIFRAVCIPCNTVARGIYCRI